MSRMHQLAGAEAAAARTPPIPPRSCPRGNGGRGCCGRSRPGSTGTPPCRGQGLAGHHDLRQGRTARKAPGIALASTPRRLPGASYAHISDTPSTAQEHPDAPRLRQAGSQAGSYPAACRRRSACSRPRSGRGFANPGSARSRTRGYLAPAGQVRLPGTSGSSSSATARPTVVSITPQPDGKRQCRSCRALRLLDTFSRRSPPAKN